MANNFAACSVVTKICCTGTATRDRAGHAPLEQDRVELHADEQVGTDEEELSPRVAVKAQGMNLSGSFDFDGGGEGVGIRG